MKNENQKKKRKKEYKKIPVFSYSHLLNKTKIIREKYDR